MKNIEELRFLQDPVVLSRVVLIGPRTNSKDDDELADVLFLTRPL
jgi:hypothetical protein